MEKLQAALESARKKRKIGAEAPQQPAGVVQPAMQDSTPRVPTAMSRVAKPEGNPNWQMIESFTPSRETLETNLIVTKTASKAATPFDILRTRILLRMQQNGWTRLAVTSPMPQSGKTTAACNLALGLARQQDFSAILFDMDLGDPSIHNFFDHRPKHSVSEVLTRQVPFEQQALRIGNNLAVSMATQKESDPTRILLANSTSGVIEEIEQTYRPGIMIFDLPSVLAGDNTQAFLSNVDCAIIIARADSTRYAQFDRCEREVAEHTNVLGVVLNACPHISAEAEFE